MIRLAVLLFLLAAPATAQPICVCLKCATGVWSNWYAPAGSMKPAILPGDCFTSRSRFDASELTPGTIVTFTHPITGADFFKRIVAVEGQTVQMAGGRLVIDGVEVPVTENGTFAETFGPQGPNGTRPRCANDPVAEGGDCLKTRLTESLGGVSYDILDIGTFPLDDTARVTVPAGHLFVLGDNRDNSIDSRLRQSAQGIGFLPVGNVTGIVEDLPR